MSVLTGQQKVVYFLSNPAIFNDVERPHTLGFKGTLFFDAEYLKNGTRYRHRNLHTPNSVISNDLE